MYITAKAKVALLQGEFMDNEINLMFILRNEKLNKKSLSFLLKY